MKVSLFCLLLFVILLAGCENPASTSLPYKTKIIDIGGWNMVAQQENGFMYSEYGIPSQDSVFSFFAMISNDSGTVISSIYDGGYIYADGIGIIIARSTGEVFDDTDYDDSTISRGTLTVCYTNN